MKSITLISCALCISVASYAQSSFNDEVALMQNMYGIEKRKLVSDYMQVPAAQATAFWSLYDKYEVDRRELGKQRLQLIAQYADNYTSLTDEKADEIAKGMLANTTKIDKLNETYYGKFKKVTSALTAAKFMQLEVYLQNEIKSEIQANIPFIGEIEMLKAAKH